MRVSPLNVLSESHRVAQEIRAARPSSDEVTFGEGDTRGRVRARARSASDIADRAQKQPGSRAVAEVAEILALVAKIRAVALMIEDNLPSGELLMFNEDWKRGLMSRAAEHATDVSFAAIEALKPLES